MASKDSRNAWLVIFSARGVSEDYMIANIAQNTRMGDAIFSQNESSRQVAMDYEEVKSRSAASGGNLGIALRAGSRSGILGHTRQTFALKEKLKHVATESSFIYQVRPLLRKSS